MKHIHSITKVPQKAQFLAITISIVSSLLSLFAIAGGIAWGISKGAGGGE